MVSYPLIGLSISVAILVMIAYYSMQHWFDTKFIEDSYLDMGLKMFPSMLYSLVVILSNLGFKFAAIRLTDWGI